MNIRTMKFLSLSFLLIFVVSGCMRKEENPEPESTKNTRTDYLKLGDSITILAQQTLLSQVVSAIQRAGHPGAVEYCNIHASSLLDSVAKANKCTIKRISLKNRNSTNAPVTDKEKEILIQFADSINAGKKVKPVLQTSDGALLYYKPIVLGMDACLKCHGDEQKDISPETLAMIKKKYPFDKATGYKLNDLRGAWKIEFANN